MNEQKVDIIELQLLHDSIQYGTKTRNKCKDEKHSNLKDLASSGLHAIGVMVAVPYFATFEQISSAARQLKEECATHVF